MFKKPSYSSTYDTYDPFLTKTKRPWNSLSSEPRKYIKLTDFKTESVKLPESLIKYKFMASIYLHIHIYN